MTNTIINLLLRLVYRIDSKHFKAALEYVREAALMFINEEDGKLRKQYVKEKLSQSFKGIASYVVNFLIELALGYLINRGELTEKGVLP